MLLFVVGAVCFHTAKFLNGPKLLIQVMCELTVLSLVKVPQSWNDNNMINLEREANSLSHTYTHTRQDGITTALRAHSFF